MKKQSLLVMLGLTATVWAEPFEFVFMSDLHFHVPGPPEEHFQRTAEQLLADGPGAFMITGGDYDNYPKTEEAVEQYLLEPLKQAGVDYPWFSAVGNHDPEWTANNWQENNDGSGRNIKGIIARNAAQPWVVDRGPAERSNLEEYKPDGASYTTFAFTYGNSRFILLDMYCHRDFDNRGKSSADDAMIDWLATDLAQAKEKHIFIFTHEPVLAFDGIEMQGAAPAPIEADSCIAGEKDRLWKLLKSDPRVVAWCCGHTHSYGLIDDDGLWQLTSAQEWANLRMFFKFTVDGDEVRLKVYQWIDDDYVTQDFQLR